MAAFEGGDGVQRVACDGRSGGGAEEVERFAAWCVVFDDPNRPCVRRGDQAGIDAERRSIVVQRHGGAI